MKRVFGGIFLIIFACTVCQDATLSMLHDKEKTVLAIGSWGRNFGNWVVSGLSTKN